MAIAASTLPPPGGGYGTLPARRLGGVGEGEVRVRDRRNPLIQLRLGSTLPSLRNLLPSGEKGGCRHG